MEVAKGMALGWPRGSAGGQAVCERPKKGQKKRGSGGPGGGARAAVGGAGAQKPKKKWFFWFLWAWCPAIRAAGPALPLPRARFLNKFFPFFRRKTRIRGRPIRQLAGQGLQRKIRRNL